MDTYSDEYVHYSITDSNGATDDYSDEYVRADLYFDANGNIVTDIHIHGDLYAHFTRGIPYPVLYRKSDTNRNTRSNTTGAQSPTDDGRESK